MFYFCRSAMTLRCSSRSSSLRHQKTTTLWPTRVGINMLLQPKPWGLGIGADYILPFACFVEVSSFLQRHFLSFAGSPQTQSWHVCFCESLQKHVHIYLHTIHYLYIYVCVCIHIYVYMYINKCKHVNTNIYIYVSISSYLPTYLPTDLPTHPSIHPPIHPKYLGMLPLPACQSPPGLLHFW